MHHICIYSEECFVTCLIKMKFILKPVYCLHNAHFLTETQMHTSDTQKFKVLMNILSLQLQEFALQHWAAAELIQSIGGIEFLTNVRGDLELRLQPTVDKILENIMHLPEASGQDHAPECIYHKTADSGKKICILGNTVLTIFADFLIKIVQYT